MSDPAVTAYLTKVLCSHGGRLERNRLADLLELPEEQIEQILEDERLRFPQSSQLVLAQSALRICTRYLHPQGEEDEESCPKLHLCRHYLRGQCAPNRRPPCRFSHDVQSDHNRAVLKANEVIGLNEAEIKVLLFQNDNQLLPEECRNYREDNCDEGEDCSRVHVCGYFIRGDCRNRFCKRSHNLLESKLLLTRSWLSRKTLQNFQMLCALKYMGRHQALRDEPRNEGPRDARGMSRGRGRGKPGYRRTGSQDLLDSREKRNEGSQFRWRSSSRPPSQCSMSQRSGDEGYNDSDSSSDHGYPKTKLDNLMDDWFAPNTSQPGKARSRAGVTPQEATRSIPTTKSSAKSASAIKPLMLQTPAQPMEPLYSRSSSKLSNTSNNTVDYGSSNAASVTPAQLMKTYQPYIHVPHSRVPPALPVSNDSEIFSTKKTTKTSIPIQKPDIEPRKILSSSMTKLSIAPVTPPSMYFTTASSSIPQPKPAPPTVSGHMGASLSSSSIIASVRADTSSGTLQASVKPIIQTETKSKAQYSLIDEDFQFLCLPPKATSSTPTQPQPANSVSSVSPGKSSQQQTTEICHANLWKYCDLGGKCTKMHYYLPYRWQLFSGIDWDDLPNMEDIERTYCDPKMDRYQLIDFQAMKSGFKSVRRLTTPSSVTQPSESVLSTEWRWYWKNEYGIWTEYGKLSRENMNATILSSDLESIYLSDPTGTIPFFAENQSYYIDCQEMKQRNSYLTEREVRRRPKFLDFQNVKMLRGSTKSATDSIQQTQPDSHLINRIYTPQRDMEVQKIGYTKVLLSQNSREFTNIVAMFSNTISDHTVKNIWQIQNSVLWERYNRQKDQMKSKNLSSTVNERQLFHGTYLANIDAICRESFDWRICGTNSGEYGQGSYFARDALYAHKYSPAGSLVTRTMFVARVLVGDFIKGNPTLRRPPQKYVSSETYDSCVDNVYNPSVFVVFEKQQAYPEFMVEYEERKTPCIVN